MGIMVKKMGKVYQYQFEIAPVDGKRKYLNKSGFATKAEALKAGTIAYNEYLNTGHSFKPSEMSYSDYLDYWMKEHCEVNLKYHTIEAYKSIIKNHVKHKIGYYRLSTITTATLQEFVNQEYLDGGVICSIIMICIIQCIQAVLLDIMILVHHLDMMINTNLL